jgi:chaperone BCS1
MARTADNSFGDDDEDENENDAIPGKVKTRVVFQPTFDTTHTIYYRGHWLRVRRGRKPDTGSEMLSIRFALESPLTIPFFFTHSLLVSGSVVARSNSILKQLVLQAKKEYEAEAVHRIQIYFADSHGSWRWTDSRHKRPMSSIVLNPGVKEMLISDTRDFLKSENVSTCRPLSLSPHPLTPFTLCSGTPTEGSLSDADTSYTASQVQARVH